MIRKIVKRLFKLHDIEDLQAGGHCGLCGNWISDQVLPKIWAWSICEKCEDFSNTLRTKVEKVSEKK